MSAIKKLLLFVLVAIFSSLYNNTVCYEKPIAVVTKVKGNCIAVRKSERIKLQLAAPIYVDDKILTFSHSYVEIMFDTGVSLRIEENSVFEVKAFLSAYDFKRSGLDIKAKLNSGSVLVDTEGLQGRSRSGTFIIVTPSVVASVRGTVFYVRISDDQTTNIAVFDGEIDCYIGSLEEEDIEGILFAKEETEVYAMKKKMVISKDKQLTVSQDLSSFAITDLSYDIIEYKRTTVENFIKASRKIRENLDKWHKRREQLIKEQKEEFKESIDKHKKEFMKEFQIERKNYKKERK